MVSLQLRKIFSPMAAALMACATVSVMAAGTPSYPVIYTATGTFGAVPLSGADTLRLAGEPFTIKLSANTGMQPAQHGPNWAIYQGLKMSGIVYSGLLGAVPTPIQSQKAQLELTVGPDDIVTATFVVNVIGIALKIQAKAYVPGGTLANPKIAPFATVDINTSGSQVTYADASAATILSLQSGSTLGAAIPTGSSAALRVFSPSDFLPVLYVRRSNVTPVPDAL